MGIEPTYSAWKADVLPLNYTRMFINIYNNGREDRIRTCDPLVPNQMRYQAAPLPDNGVPGETRTPNLLIRSQTLYPVELRARNIMERTTRLELATPTLARLCSTN
jgi:hypothetical protein